MKWPLVLLASLALSLGGCAAAANRGHAQTATSRVSTATDCADGTGFSLSLVSDRGGQATPTAAATWFASHGGVQQLPAKGWVEVSSDDKGASVRSGSVTLHTVKGSDGTWQVDSGGTCG